jgi:hypothetical protein
MKSLISEIWKYIVYTFEFINDPEYGWICSSNGTPMDFSETLYRCRLFTALWNIAGQTVLITLCHYKGHKWYVESNCGPESGSEDFYCERCGYSHHIIYY